MNDSQIYRMENKGPGKSFSDELIHQLIKDSTKRMNGHVLRKEFNANKFVTALFNNFSVIENGSKRQREVAVRLSIQLLIADNTTPSFGGQRNPELMKDEFVRELSKKFTITPKQS